MASDASPVFACAPRQAAVTALAQPAPSPAGDADACHRSLAPAVGGTDAPGPVSVVATASKTEVSVGEVFTLELKATGPPGTTYEFAREAADEGFELRTPVPPTDAQASPLPADVHRYEAVVFAHLEGARSPGSPFAIACRTARTGEAASAPVTRERRLAAAQGPPAAEARGHPRSAAGVDRAAFWIALAAACC